VNTTYVFRVKSFDVFRNPAWSSLASFTTALPNAPPAPILTPNRLVAVVSDPETVTFAWSPVSSPIGNPISYRIQISNAADFSSLVRDVTMPLTSYTTDLPVVSSYYYWRVLATDGTVYSPWSNVETTLLYWDW
jgi:hypothetical protein